MTFFSNNLNSNVNNNMVPLPMSFAQDAQGINYFFVGTIPQIPMIPQPTLVTPIMITPIPRPLQVVEEDDECCFFLTEKGIRNNIMGTPPQPQKKGRSYRRRMAATSSSHLAPVPALQQAPRLNKKRVLEQYQDQLVARPAVPVANSFSPLRVVRNNSHTGQIRRVWEVPQPRPQQAQVQSGRPKPPTSTNVIYQAHKAMKERKQRRWQQRTNEHVQQTPIPARESVKTRLTFSNHRERTVYVPRESGRQSKPRPHKMKQVWIPKESSSQQAHEDFQESVFNRLGHRVKSGPPPVNKNLVITTSNPSHKKRRVVEQAEQHFSVYMAHVGVDDYEEDDILEDITNVFFEPDLARAHVIVTRCNSRNTNPEMEHTAIKENERGRQEDPNKEDDEVSDSGTTNPDELLKVRLKLQEQQITVQQKEIKELKKQNDEIFKMMQSMQAFMMGGKASSNENPKEKPEEVKDDNEIEERPSTSTRRPYKEVNRSNENTSRMPDHQSITKKEVQELVR
jgi:hypothetical protein